MVSYISFFNLKRFLTPLIVVSSISLFSLKEISYIFKGMLGQIIEYFLKSYVYKKLGISDDMFVDDKTRGCL